MHCSIKWRAIHTYDMCVNITLMLGYVHKKVGYVLRQRLCFVMSCPQKVGGMTRVFTYSLGV